MNAPRRLLAIAGLCACAGLACAAPADTMQDGIAVRPLPSYRKLVSEQQLDQQAQAQYLDLLNKAHQQGALGTDSNREVIRLRAIARRLIPFAVRWNPDAANWHWQVNLLRSKEVNAFCMPGGHIAFFSGILTTLKLTDDEVAAVMGHEITHALREHGRERAAQSTAANALTRAAGIGMYLWKGVDPRLTESLAGGAAHVALLKFSRDDEREADLIGLDLAARAGYDPRAGLALWKKMAALNQQAPLPWLSTHPGGQERIAQIETHLNVLLPLYAQAKGLRVDALPPYRGAYPTR